MEKYTISVHLKYFLFFFIISLFNCESKKSSLFFDPELEYPFYLPTKTDIIISREKYIDQLQGFWLGQSIANWTGLITEMDKVSPPFYTDEDWGGPDQKNIWGHYISPKDTIIDFYIINTGTPWGADDDTDIEYMYQHLLDENNVSVLSPEQIKEGWLNHIYSNENAPSGENYLWVSNETAYYLMMEGIFPPETSNPNLNSNYSMIDAQLTTEIFGVLCPIRNDIAIKMAHLPIRVTAKLNSEWVSKFYVSMHSLASKVDSNLNMKDQIEWLAKEARKTLPNDSYSAKIFDHVRKLYLKNPDKNNWEKTRDQIYERYQLNSNDGYTYKNPFDSGINFAASLISLFYGQGNLKRTIQIGTLAGWDSDNPTATWGGLLGFILGKKKIMKIFNNYNISDDYWIHRTRRNFKDRTPGTKGEDTFEFLAKRAIFIIDRVVIEEMKGGVDLEKNFWYIPKTK